MAKNTQPKPRQPKNSSAPAKPVTQAEVSAKEAPQGASSAAALQDPATSVRNDVVTTPHSGDVVTGGTDAAAVSNATGGAIETVQSAASSVIGAVATPGLQVTDADKGAAALAGDGTGDTLEALVAESIIVTSDVDGFRRAGRPWSKSPTTVSLDELSREQLAMLEGEPMLKVVYVAAGDKRTES